MSEMVERIARLICEYNGDDPDHLNKYIGSMPDGFEWELQAPLARQIIAAMREPTEAMRATGSDSSENVIELGDVEYVPEERIEKVWQAMIDEALKP